MVVYQWSMYTPSVTMYEVTGALVDKALCSVIAAIIYINSVTLVLLVVVESTLIY